MEIQEQWIEAPEVVRVKCRAICGENDIDKENNEVYIYRRKEIDTATDIAYQAGLKECEERVREERERMMHEINARVDNLSRCPEKPQRRNAFHDGFSDCLDQVMLILGKKVDCTNCMDRGYVKNILFDFLEKCDHPSHKAPTKTDKTTEV